MIPVLFFYLNPFPFLHLADTLFKETRSNALDCIRSDHLRVKAKYTTAALWPDGFDYQAG